MKARLSSLILVLVICVSLDAAILTVDNNNPSAGQYASIQAAVTAASNDDIIYVYPSLIPYQAFNLNKRLKIYGTGWRSDGVNIRGTSISGDVQLQGGSDNSLISGFGGFFNIKYSNNNNIHIDECCLSYFGTFNGSTSDTSHGMLITGTYFSGQIGTSPYIINSEGNGISIYNCVFNQGITSARRIIDKASANITVVNSILRSGTERVFVYANSSNGIPNLRNNYIEAAGYSTSGENTSLFPSSPTIMYNIGSGNIFPGGYNNLNNLSINSVYNYSNNGSWTAIDGSPAIDAGDPDPEYNDVDGTRNDIGAYGGPYPINTRGSTTLPSIMEMSGTLYTSPSQGLQIHIEASSRR